MEDEVTKGSLNTVVEGPILSIKEMRQVDAKAVSQGIPVHLMMENAGNALARYMLQGLGDLNQKKIVVVCGLSNNGGGGFASARHLSYYGANVTVLLLGRPDDIRTDDARIQWRTIEKINSISKIAITNKEELEKVVETITDADGIIDAIFGTGFTSTAIKEPARSAIDFINLSKGYIVSNDVPSGADADNGIVTEKSVKPNIVVVLHKMKKGLKEMKILLSKV